MRAAEILARFEAVSEEKDGGFLARCIAHGDSTPSLRIWFGEDGRCRMVCRAGCDTADIIRAAGLTWRDMFDVADIMVAVPETPPEPVGPRHLRALREYMAATMEALQQSPEALEYLARRFGVTPGLAESYGLGFDNGTVGGLPFRSAKFRAHPRITVPLLDAHGIPRGLQGRDISGQCPDRWLSLSNPRGHRWASWGLFRAVPDTGVAIVTEGPGDGLTALSEGYSALVIRGAALAHNAATQEEVRSALRGQRVYVAGDGDQAGARFAERVGEAVGARGIKMPHHKWDLSEWRTKRPDFAAELAVKIEKARPPAKVAQAQRLADFAAALGES